jgi:hypothetical protein
MQQIALFHAVAEVSLPSIRDKSAFPYTVYILIILLKIHLKFMVVLKRKGFIFVIMDGASSCPSLPI